MSATSDNNNPPTPALQHFSISFFRLTTHCHHAPPCKKKKNSNWRGEKKEKGKMLMQFTNLELNAAAGKNISTPADHHSSSIHHHKHMSLNTSPLPSFQLPRAAEAINHNQRVVAQ
jgi:hypothetical protein